MRYRIKTNTKEFCDTIVTSIARYEKFRCWASRLVTIILGSVAGYDMYSVSKRFEHEQSGEEEKANDS